MLERDIVAIIINKITSDELVLITGARQTGKTTALSQIHQKLNTQGEISTYITLEDPEFLRLLNEHPERLWQIVPRLSDRRQYVLIDEIQYLANPTNFLKYHYDLNKGSVKLIVTGSSAFYLDQHFNDSLAGRKIIYNLPTLSLKEFLRFRQREDLSLLLSNNPDLSHIPLIRRRDLTSLAEEYMTYGAYPGVVLAQGTEDKKELLFELFSSYLKRDFTESGLKSTDTAYHLLKLLAWQSGNELNRNSLSKELGINRKTLDDLLLTLQKTFHVTLIRPFFSGHPKELRKMPKLYFLDLGMRNAILRNFELPSQRKDVGQLYENYVFRFLYDSYKGSEIQYWRTQAGNEVDFVIDGKHAYEVKWNSAHINEGKLKQFRELYPDMKMNYIAHNASGQYMQF